jgi:hypothetical protein
MRGTSPFERDADEAIALLDEVDRGTRGMASKL